MGSTVHRVEHEPCGSPAELLEREVDRRQRWPGGGRHDLPVVDADDRDLVADEAAGLAQPVTNVAAAGDRVPAPSLAPVAVPDAASDGSACGRDRPQRRVWPESSQPNESAVR